MIKRFEQIISKYIPRMAVPVCVQYWEKEPFSFKVTRMRKSKIGDYRFNHKTGQHEITVNGSLNQYAFLITYVHEVAHLWQYQQFGANKPPHGRQWKTLFQQLMDPFLKADIFPLDLLVYLTRHMQNPKASSQSDPILTKLLRKYDEKNTPNELYLEDLTEGDSFQLNGRTFTKLRKRRTRSVCVEERTGRKFLISELARIERKFV